MGPKRGSGRWGPEREKVNKRRRKILNNNIYCGEYKCLYRRELLNVRDRTVSTDIVFFIIIIFCGGWGFLGNNRSYRYRIVSVYGYLYFEHFVYEFYNKMDYRG